MPLRVYRLRRLLAAIAILLTLAVAGMYFYARSKATNAIKKIPAKIGYNIKQTAEGFQFSKSDGNRTLFTVQASNVKEFKLNGNAELHNVSILLYGRDSSRFDQIYGDDFAFNQKTGDVTAKGEVQIDLVANPAGLESPDQTAPKDLKNPIHLKTRDLVFNKDSGNAWTDARVEFRKLRQPAAGRWEPRRQTNTLTLASQIHIELSGPEAAVIEAKHGIITNEPRQIVLEDPQLTRLKGTVRERTKRRFIWAGKSRGAGPRHGASPPKCGQSLPDLMARASQPKSTAAPIRRSSYFRAVRTFCALQL
jgi:lipopolysaccharide export system protein LptA